MTAEPIEEGFDVFLHDGEKAFGAVIHVAPKHITIYIENSGNFDIPLAAIKDVHDEKVVLDPAKLEQKLRDAIRRAHSGEDPTI